VQSRLTQCQRLHNACRGPKKILLPKRVLEIQEDDKCNLIVRLTEPTDGSQGAYAALSHCWGNSRSCVTTKLTLEDRKRGISWESIPKTFQDAIKLTSILDIRFIWIDSLCIIQDDLDDWNTESAKMADVYQLATLTLSATASSGDAQGCYPAPSNTIGDLEVTLPDDVGACEIAIRQPIAHWDAVGQGELHRRFPLMSRGWAFQERLLSRRLLHFCDSELVWECREITTCECGGLGKQMSPAGTYDQAIKASEIERQGFASWQSRVQDHLRIRHFQEEQNDKMWNFIMPGLRRGSAKSVQRWLSNEGKPESALPSHLDPKTDVSEMQECADFVFHFHRIVEQYSTLKLTKRSDRLPALSGLCKRIQHIRGEYAAGLWLESLCFDLLWRVERLHVDDMDVPRRDEEYCGPSWSWVSACDPVVYWPDIVNFHDASRLFKPPRLGQVDTQQRKPFSKPKCLGRNLKDDSVLLKLAGKNPFGNLAYALIKGEASTTTATLRYTYSSFWHDGTNKLDLSRYKLTLGADGVIELPFWADYALGAEGPGHIPNGSELTLFLVHPRVCLVLLDMGLRFSMTPRYRRVGVTRISENMVNYYKIDWMEFSEVKSFTIV
jgi:hypothetical protein